MAAFNRILHPGRIIQKIIKDENSAFYKTLTKKAEVVEVSLLDIDENNEANKKIYAIGDNPSILLIHPTKSIELRKNPNFVNRWRHNTAYLEMKDKAFEGRLGGLHVYVNNGVPKGEGVIYDRNECQISMTSLDVHFNSYKHPTRLIITEKLFAYTIDEGAVIKLNLV